MIGLAQLDDEVVRGGLLGLMARARTRGDEEGWVGVVPEVVAHDLEGAGRVAERAGHLGRGVVFDEVGAQGLVLALLGRGRLEKETLRLD